MRCPQEVTASDTGLWGAGDRKGGGHESGLSWGYRLGSPEGCAGTITWTVGWGTIPFATPQVQHPTRLLVPRRRENYQKRRPAKISPPGRSRPHGLKIYDITLDSRVTRCRQREARTGARRPTGRARWPNPARTPSASRARTRQPPKGRLRRVPRDNRGGRFFHPETKSGGHWYPGAGGCKGFDAGRCKVSTWLYASTLSRPGAGGPPGPNPVPSVAPALPPTAELFS